MLGEDSGYIIPVFASRLVLHPTALRGLVSNYDTLYGLRGAWIES
jgi:hypothetical protein